MAEERSELWTPPWPRSLKVDERRSDIWEEGDFYPISEKDVDQYKLTKQDLYRVAWKDWINLDEATNIFGDHKKHRFYSLGEVILMAEEKPRMLAQVRQNAWEIRNEALDTKCRFTKDRTMNYLMESWLPLPDIPAVDSGTLLPTEIWGSIFSKVCDSPASTLRQKVRDIGSIVLVCKEFYAMEEDLWEELSRACPLIEGDPRAWKRFVTNPKQIQPSELFGLVNAACPVSGTENRSGYIMMLELLDHLGICRPCRAPARLLVTVEADRKREIAAVMWELGRQ